MVITARSENRSIVDLEPVLIHFISEKITQLLRLWSVGCWQRPEDDRCLRKYFHRKDPVLIKCCLEPSYLLTARVFSIHVVISKGFEKWNVFLPKQHAFYFTRSSCSALFTIIDGTRQSRWQAWPSWSENRSCIWTIEESRRGIAAIFL